MLPYLIAGVIGYGISKLFEDNKAPKYNDGGLVAPNGKPSNLTPEQYKLVRTKAFKDWFGDWENDPENASKVVDSNGEPLVVYHGTKENWWNDYFVFNPQYEGKSSNIKRRKFGSIYFTSKKKVAQTFGNILIPVFLNFKNPIVIDGDYHDIMWVDDELETTNYEDDIIIKNTYDYRVSNVKLDADMSSDIFLVSQIFNKIKLADGTNTTFDGSNPDIRFDGGGNVNDNSFEKWFNNSKVVDKKGNPLIVYHGSPDLRGLKEKYIFKSRFADNQSFFFTDNYSMAKSYADPKNAFDYQNAEEGVIGLYLSLQNPLIVNAFNQIWRKFEITIDGNEITGTRNLIKFAKDKGYDGVIVENVRDYYNNNEKKTKGGNLYVAFEPTQIKLADGTNTTFDSNNPDIRFNEGGVVPKTSKDEYGNWSGEYLGNKFSIYKLNEGWKFSFTYYSPLIQSEKNYFSSDDFSPFKTKKDAVNTLLEKIKEINEENESIIAQRKSKFNDGGLIKLNDFNKKVKGELKKSDYDYAKTIDEKRKVITFLYAHEYYQINNIIPLAEPDDDVIYWQLVSINGKEYIIGIYLTFHDFDNRLKITDSEITFYDVDYNELPNPIKMEEGGLIAPNGKPSNLTPEQYKLVRTKAFKDWFGDWENDPENASKVVDENGEPKVVTHSTPNEDSEGNKYNYPPFNIFDGNRIFNTPNSSVIPIWFSYKGNYAVDKTILNMLFFLNIKKLFLFSNQNHLKQLQKYMIEKYENYDVDLEYDYNNNWEAIEDENLPAYISEIGFDGYKTDSENAIAIFKSEQGKLADGTNTTFDGNNPDIRYADGGYIRNIKKLYTEDDSDVYGGDFGQAGGINWRINPETNFLYLMGIGRNNRGENSVKSKGEGSRALAYLFELYPEVDKIYFEIEGEEGAWKFYKKIGAEEEGGGKITENTYNAELSRTALRNYFVKKNNPDIRFDGGGNIDDVLDKMLQGEELSQEDKNKMSLYQKHLLSGENDNTFEYHRVSELNIADTNSEEHINKSQIVVQFESDQKIDVKYMLKKIALTLKKSNIDSVVGFGFKMLAYIGYFVEVNEYDIEKAMSVLKNIGFNATINPYYNTLYFSNEVKDDIKFQKLSENPDIIILSNSEIYQKLNLTDAQSVTRLTKLLKNFGITSYFIMKNQLTITDKSKIDDLINYLNSKGYNAIRFKKRR